MCNIFVLLRIYYMILFNPAFALNTTQQSNKSTIFIINNSKIVKIRLKAFVVITTIWSEKQHNKLRSLLSAYMYLHSSTQEEVHFGNIIILFARTRIEKIWKMENSRWKQPFNIRKIWFSGSIKAKGEKVCVHFLSFSKLENEF